jgi:hypothetical protein
MPQADWRLEGEWIKNCTCAFGCPCDFNAPPTHGDCQGLLGMRITKGHFKDVTLDGLSDEGVANNVGGWLLAFGPRGMASTLRLRVGAGGLLQNANTEVAALVAGGDPEDDHNGDHDPNG